jgi:exoribonuclease R
MISGIVHLKSKTLYGFTSNKTPIYLFQPFDTSIEPFLVGCSEKDRSQNIVGLAKIIESSGRISRGALEQVLGKCGDRSAEELGVLWRYSTHRWNPRKLPEINRPSFNRRVLDVPTINIDPEGCTDIDDCISIWDDKIAITIADVHEWVLSNPWLVDKASQIGQTIYNNGKITVPMLPPVLSDNLCSLLPMQERLGISLIFNQDLTYLHIEPTVIINKKSYTYENVKDAKDFPVDILQKVVERLVGKEVDDPHKWVEHLMILYNRYVANHLDDTGIWRGHSAPDSEKLERYSKFGPDMEKLAYSSAIYTSTPAKHWGLGDIIYCHATSPIRRWADVVNQSVLKQSNIEYNIETLNVRSSNAKKYERDVFFLQKLFEEPIKLKDCTVLDSNEKRSRVWVPLWNRIITLNKGGLKEGEKLLIDYYLNLDAPSWKKRIVFRVEDTNSQEQQHHEQSSDVGPW